MNSVLSRRWTAGYAVFLVAALAHTGWSQVVPAPGQPIPVQPAPVQPAPVQPLPAPGQPGLAPQPAGVAGQATDQFIGRWLLIDNNGEIALSRWGEERASSKDVKDFAQMMIREHTDFGNRLQQAIAGGAAAGAQLPLRDGRSAVVANPQPGSGAQPQPSTQGEHRAGFRGIDQPNVPGANAGGAGGGPLHPLRLKQTVAERMNALLERELSDKEGAHFDQGFMHAQLALHLHMLAGLESTREHVSPQVRQVLDQGIAHTQKHLEHARVILARIEGGTPHQHQQPPDTPAR